MFSSVGTARTGPGPAVLASAIALYTSSASAVPLAGRQNQDQQRWAVRGCPVGDECHGPIQTGLIERTEEPDAPTLSPKATTLRPDLPWLDRLAMPDIPVRWNHRTIRFLEFYRSDPKGRAIMSGWLRAQNRYRRTIEQELRRADLPLALLYIAMIESSYDPHEYSRTGASGLWQFMPAGGVIYGLRQDRWLDERNDPVRSTQAAIDYFRDLFHRFGNWDLALAAYNAGYGAVLKSVATYNSNDYWVLAQTENGLPWEAVEYVPKFLAAAIVGANREFFGFSDIDVVAELPPHLLEVPGSMRLNKIASVCGLTTEQLTELNPQLRSNRTPPGLASYPLRVPLESDQDCGKKLRNPSSSLQDADPYRVRQGERFEDIATIHGISRSDLKILNGLSSESEVRANTIILVPKRSSEEKKANAAIAHDALYASGEPGAQSGQPLVVAVPDPNMSIAGHSEYFYRVVSGDTLFGVARAFGVERSKLALWNGLNKEAHLHPRMVLRIFARRNFSPQARGVKVLDATRILVMKSGSEEHLDHIEHQRGRRRITYRAKKPESLGDIGAKYGLSKWDMARINRMPPESVIAPDDTVLVYEVVDPKRSSRAEEQQRAAPTKTL